MFHFEELQNPIVDQFNKITKYVNILPLDNIPVQLPKIWKINQTCMPELYKNRAEDFANFKIRKDDVWIITYPKCGTTWTQEMTWMLMKDMDFVKANSMDITQRSIFFEFNGIVLESWDAFKVIEDQKSPRVLKSHLPIGLLPRGIWRKKCKVIYVTRNPKDAAVSFFHHFHGIHNFSGTIEDFTEAFLSGHISYGSYWNHVLEFWMIREVENVLFLTYEDMSTNLKSIIDRTCTFLEKNYNGKQISELIDHLSFEKMKANPMSNNQSLVKFLYESTELEYKEETAFKFMRKGKVGDYKNELPQRCINEINIKTREVFEPHGLYLYCADD